MWPHNDTIHSSTTHSCISAYIRWHFMELWIYPMSGAFQTQKLKIRNFKMWFILKVRISGWLILLSFILSRRDDSEMVQVDMVISIGCEDRKMPQSPKTWTFRRICATLGKTFILPKYGPRDFKWTKGWEKLRSAILFKLFVFLDTSTDHGDFDQFLGPHSEHDRFLGPHSETVRTHDWWQHSYFFVCLFIFCFIHSHVTWHEIVFFLPISPLFLSYLPFLFSVVSPTLRVCRAGWPVCPAREGLGLEGFL